MSETTQTVCPKCDRERFANNENGMTVWQCGSSRRFPQGNLIQSPTCRIRELSAALAAKEAENVKLRERVGELEQEKADEEVSFDMRWKADMRGIKRWQAATGRALVWPSTDDLTVWLLEQIDSLEAKLAEHAK